MIYPPSDHRRSHGRASALELALWIVGMAAFAVVVLVAAGVQPPFEWPGQPDSTPTPLVTPVPWPTAVVPLPPGAGAAAASPSPVMASPQESPSWRSFPESGWPTEAPTTPFSFPQPTLPMWSGEPTPYSEPTLPPQASPQWGRPLPTATSFASDSGTPTAETTPTATPLSAYP